MSLLRVSFMMIAMMVGCAQATASDGWSTFKGRFMTEDGRIQDTAINIA